MFLVSGGLIKICGNRIAHGVNLRRVSRAPSHLVPMKYLPGFAGTSRRPLASGCALLVCLVTPGLAQYTGEFSAATLGTGDSDALVGLRSDKEYLYAINLGNAPTLTINGVTFTGVGGTDPSVG